MLYTRIMKIIAIPNGPPMAHGSLTKNKEKWYNI